MVKKILSAALITACVSTSAFAFEQQGIKKGNSVVGLDLRYNSQTITPTGGGASSTTTTTALNGTYSYFITDAVEIGASLGTSTSSPETGPDQTSQNIGVIANYNFADFSPTMVPYLGVNVSGYSSEDGTATTDESGYGGEAGLKIFVSEKTSIVPAVYYSAFGDIISETGLKVAFQVYF